MQSLDYKLKTSNTNYARHDVQYFPSSLSSFSPATSRVCRIPLTSGTSFIDPESIKIAFTGLSRPRANLSRPKSLDCHCIKGSRPEAVRSLHLACGLPISYCLSHFYQGLAKRMAALSPFYQS